MFNALWVHNGKLKPISAEEALSLERRKDEQFISSDNKDIREKLEEENLEPLTEEEYNLLFAVTPRKGYDRTRNNKKSNVRPHFKRHLNIKDYRKMFPDDTRRGEIIRDLIHKENSRWHNNWVSALGEFCDITEKRVKDEETEKYKYPDALCKATNTVFEVQHTYIGSRYYEERNAFYKNLGYQIVWIIDCTKTEPIYHDKQVEITENSCQSPIFKLLTYDIEKYDIIYAQMKGGKIYRVYNAKQSKDENGLGNAIWGFNPIEEYDNQDKFIEAVKNRTDYQIKNLWDILREGHEMQARIIGPREEKMDVLVGHFPGYTAPNSPFKVKKLHQEGSKCFWVSGTSEVIQTYTEPVKLIPSDFL